MKLTTMLFLILLICSVGEADNITNKRLHYAEHNKGEFVSGYYFPSIYGIFERSSSDCLITLEPGVYILTRAIELPASSSSNTYDGQGATLQAMKDKEITGIRWRGYNNLFINFILEHFATAIEFFGGHNVVSECIFERENK